MKLILNTLLFLAITNLYAQNSIKGTVLDAYTKEGLAFVNVYFTDIEKGTSTNEKGAFTLENLPSGSHTMLVSFIGYETKSLKIFLTSHKRYNYLCAS